MQIRTRVATYLWAAALVGLVVPAPAPRADTGAAHQGANAHFGVSGGNVKDRSIAYCCSGTLGAMVQDATGSRYVLSNNHVLARSDQAKPGEDISQPGLIDNFCRLAGTDIVADFTVAPKLGSNVDAAIARLRQGAMDPTGAIQDIGTISGVIKAPAIGLGVAKSGRTTGFTTATIGSINTTVSVQYQRGCGVGKKFTVRYTNQVVMQSSTFSAGGDSGALIVTNDPCHQPVALLFAGSSTATVANPIGEVLSRVSASLGSALSFVGDTCHAASTQGNPNGGGLAGPSREAVTHATAMMRQHVEELMARPGVLGVGIGAAERDPSEAVIMIYVDQLARRAPRLPPHLHGIRVNVIHTDPFVAY